MERTKSGGLQQKLEKRFSTKSWRSSKDQQTNKDKKKAVSKDEAGKQSKPELEDSGVHLEDLSSSGGVHSGSQDDDLGVTTSDLSQPLLPAPTSSGKELSLSSPPSPSASPFALSSMTHKKDTIAPPQTFAIHCAVSAPDLGPSHHRTSKSESPQPPTRYPPSPSSPTATSSLSPSAARQFPPLAGCGIPADFQRHSALVGDPSGGGGTRTGGGGGRPHFSLNSEDDSDQESQRKGGGGAGGNVRNTSSSSVTTSGTTTNQRGREKSSNKDRFRKSQKPRRSHSAGSGKDVPAHALFLRHDPIKGIRPKTSNRLGADKGRSSMDRGHSDDSDSDQPESAKSTVPAKAKKKTLAQDMKEKFSFLRRRPTDTSLQGKDGKPPKPTKEMVINWSQSFENLLKDKVGLEWFKDFLGTEFSEENVEFWIACEEYKSIKPNKLNARAQEIFTDFVAVQAPREINLDSKTRMETKALVEKPNRETFELAQKRIQALMDKDSYPRFLRSDGYQKLLSEYKIQLNLT